MTMAGWIFMLVSVGFVWGLAIWSYSKLLRVPPPDSDSEG